MSDERDTAGAGRATDLLNAFLARNQVGGIQARAILDTAAVEIFKAFDDDGIDALLLKGAGLASLLYEPSEQRGYVDIDLLVHPRDLGSAAGVLARLGYRNASERLGIDDIGGVVHADTWTGTAREITYPVQIELHRWLPGTAAAPDIAWESLRKRTTTIEVDGWRVPVLARDGQALQLATHAAQHGPQYLKGVRELTLALERWPEGVWREAARLADEIGATEAFGAGLRLVGRGTELAARLGVARSDALEWEVRHLGERPRGVFHLDAFRSSRSASDRLDVMRRGLLPNRRWITGEYRWAVRGRTALVLAYGLHILRAPLWAARAWRFRRRGRAKRAE